MPSSFVFRSVFLLALLLTAPLGRAQGPVRAAGPNYAITAIAPS